MIVAFVEWISEKLGLVVRERWALEQAFVVLKGIFSSGRGFCATITIFFELISMLLTGSAVTPYGQELDLSDYSLVFCDEFDAQELDTDIWNYRRHGEIKTGYYSPSQVRLEDGNLIITSEYLEDGEFGAGWYSASVALNEMYPQGYFEIRAVCNNSPSIWSAFWLQSPNSYNAEISKGGVGGAEIDIFESFGYGESGKDDSVTMTVHCAGVEGYGEGINSALLGCFNGKNIRTEYNTYGLEWNEEEYIFYINGVEAVRSSFGDGVSESLEEVILSLELPIDKAELEQFDKENFKTEYIIDYIRIYQKTAD